MKIQKRHESVRRGGRRLFSTQAHPLAVRAHQFRILLRVGSTMDRDLEEMLSYWDGIVKLVMGRSRRSADLNVKLTAFIAANRLILEGLEPLMIHARRATNFSALCTATYLPAEAQQEMSNLVNTLNEEDKGQIQLIVLALKAVITTLEKVGILFIALVDVNKAALTNLADSEHEWIEFFWCF